MFSLPYSHYSLIARSEALRRYFVEGCSLEAAAPPVKDPHGIADSSTLRRWFRALDSSLWASAYAVVSEEKWFKLWFGAVESLVGFGVMIRQLVAFQQGLVQPDISLRWTILIGSSVALSKGLKDLDQGLGWPPKNDK